MKGSKRTVFLVGAGFLAIILIVFLLLLIFCKQRFYRTAYPLKYIQEVEETAQAYEIDQYLLYAVIKTESNFDPEATSHIPARGLMQITGETFDWIKMKLQWSDDTTYDEMYDPETNLMFGGYLLSYLLDEFDNTETALAAYHAGRSRVNSWLSSSEYSSDGKTLDHIPYGDTRSYVKTVAQAYTVYKKLYDKESSSQ